MHSVICSIVIVVVIVVVVVVVIVVAVRTSDHSLRALISWLKTFIKEGPLFYGLNDG